MPPLNLTGAFYLLFTDNSAIYGETDKACIQQTVERLLSVETSAAQPGMLLGKIQSGKTKTFLGVIALAFDNEFDIAVILTKGTKALARQTLERVRRDFARFTAQDQLQIFDIMTVPSALAGYELNQKLVFVAKKQVDNMERLTKLFRQTYPQLVTRRILLIDDEADYASIGFKNTKEEGIVINRTSRQIDGLRQILTNSAFLQVTATPYSLYLQPEDLVVNGVEFRPVRPAFTELLPVNNLYVGSDYYFDRSQEENTVASFVYRPLTLEELEILRQEDRRRFRIESCLTSEAISSLRRAICNFVVGGCLRRLQDEQAGQPLRKFSFLFHTESAKTAHAWQDRVVTAINQKLMEAVSAQPELLRQLLTESYNDLANSVRVLNRYLLLSMRLFTNHLLPFGKDGSQLQR